MAIKTCDCENNGLGNLGAPSCQLIAGVTGSMFLVPTFKSDGTPNYIDLTSDVLNQAYFEGKLYNADPSLRWQWIPTLDSVTNERAESLVQELDSGKKIRIRQGIKAFSGDIYGMSYTYLGKLKLAGCSDASAFPVDLGGNMIGRRSDDQTKFYPIRIDKPSYDPIYVEPTDTTAARINLAFDWHQSELDECLKIISASEITADFLTLRSVIDANLKEDASVTASATAIGVDVSMDYGTAFTNKAIQGLTAADFVVVSGGTANTPDTVTETSPGKYAFDFTTDSLSSPATVTLADGIAFEENASLEITF